MELSSPKVLYAVMWTVMAPRRFDDGEGKLQSTVRWMGKDLKIMKGLLNKPLSALGYGWHKASQYGAHDYRVQGWWNAILQVGRQETIGKW